MPDRGEFEVCGVCNLQLGEGNHPGLSPNVAAERERCAKVVETSPAIMLRKDLAAKIRSGE